MHKKLASDLNSLAHDILKMRDKNDVFALKEKASKVYEKLSLLAYVEEYLNTTPQATETKEELLDEIEKAEQKKVAIEEKPIENVVQEKVETLTVEQKIEETVKVEESIKELKENKIEPIESPTNEVILNVEPKDKISSIEVVDEELILPELKIDDIVTPIEPVQEKNEVVETPKIEKPIVEEPIEEIKEPTSDVKNPTLKDELQDTISVDVMANLFKKAEPKQSLNDRLSNKNSTIQIGLNDRIAFVNHLFKGNQSEFNRVIRHLNASETQEDAIEFIKYSVKPEYDWSEKEEYEERLFEIIERKFS